MPCWKIWTRRHTQRKVATIFNNGDSDFTNKDCGNHIRNLWSRNLDVGDAQAIFNYCRQKQVKNSKLLCAIQCDDDNWMVFFLDRC